MAKGKIGNIYLDTNILQALNFNIHEDPQLLTFRKSFSEIPIHIPSVVVEELVAIKRDGIKGKLYAIKRDIGQINKHTTAKIKLDFMEDKILDEMVTNLRENIKKAGIEIFETPIEKINFRKITDMAVNKLKPFNETGKGFKDTVILFSVLEHCKQIKDLQHIFVTMNTKDYTQDEILAITQGEGVDLKILYSLEELTKYLSDCMNEKVRVFIERRESHLKEFLLSQKDTIMTFMKQGEFAGYMFTREMPFVGSVEKVDGIEFVQISNPNAGWLDNIKEGDVDISFKLKLKFILLVRKTVYKSPRYKVGESPTISEVANYGEKYEKNAVDKEVSVKGKIHIKETDGKEVFTDLRLEEFSDADLWGRLLGTLER